MATNNSSTYTVVPKTLEREIYIYMFLNRTSREIAERILVAHGHVKQSFYSQGGFWLTKSGSCDYADSRRWVSLEWITIRKQEICHSKEKWGKDLRQEKMIIKKICRPGVVDQACNPSTLEGWGRWITRSRDRDHPGQHGETPSLLKIQKISWACWCVPVIPATQEGEAGELPEPRRWRLWWAEITPLHYSLGNKSETLSQKKKIC